MECKRLYISKILTQGWVISTHPYTLNTLTNNNLRSTIKFIRAEGTEDTQRLFIKNDGLIAIFIENMYICLDYDCNRGFIPQKQLTISVCLAGEAPLIDFLIRGQSAAFDIFEYTSATRTPCVPHGSRVLLCHSEHHSVILRVALSS